MDARTGAPLVLYFDVTARGAEDKSSLDWMRKQFQKLNIQLVVRSTDYNRFQDKIRKGNAQIFEWGWNADYPDAGEFPVPAARAAAKDRGMKAKTRPITPTQNTTDCSSK